MTNPAYTHGLAVIVLPKMDSFYCGGPDDPNSVTRLLYPSSTLMGVEYTK